MNASNLAGSAPMAHNMPTHSISDPESNSTKPAAWKGRVVTVVLGVAAIGISIFVGLSVGLSIPWPILAGVVTGVVTVVVCEGINWIGGRILNSPDGFGLSARSGSFSGEQSYIPISSFRDGSPLLKTLKGKLVVLGFSEERAEQHMQAIIKEAMEKKSGDQDKFTLWYQASVSSSIFSSKKLDFRYTLTLTSPRNKMVDEIKERY